MFDVVKKMDQQAGHKIGSRWLLGLVLLATVTLGAGCSTTAKILNLDTEVVLNFQVWPKINPDDNGRASPLVVRVYELKDSRQFLAEDFIDLFEESKERLGADLLAEHRLRELTPGLNRTETFELAPEVKYIGLLGEFIQYENAQARVVFAVEPNRTTKKIIWINKTKLRVGDGDKPDDIE